ncbi:helix-turn-helix transcriptional regulator [Allocoleopsis sp.]|uniref:helix-turn-helix transcriptional regulator n=1 Tax=Allocoleopsis sp. TaxID=3088169 RepID=UPI002FD07170
MVGRQLEIETLIRVRRQPLELTQEKLAAKLGVTFLTVNFWENSRGRHSPLAMEKIEGMLRSALDGLFILLRKRSSAEPNGSALLTLSLFSSASVTLRIRKLANSLVGKYSPEEEHRL